MPAKSPPIDERLAAKLVVLGSQVRAQRQRLKVSATAAAEAAGMSRITLHRVERGEPSVTAGAYLSAIAALGLDLALVSPVHGLALEPVVAPAQKPAKLPAQTPTQTPAKPPAQAPAQTVAHPSKPGLPASVPLNDYPQLKRLAWHLHGVSNLTPQQALSLYERNWRHIHQASLAPQEQALIQALAAALGGGRLLV